MKLNSRTKTSCYTRSNTTTCKTRSRFLRTINKMGLKLQLLILEINIRVLKNLQLQRLLQRKSTTSWFSCLMNFTRTNWRDLSRQTTSKSSMLIRKWKMIRVIVSLVGQLQKSEETTTKNKPTTSPCLPTIMKIIEMSLHNSSSKVLDKFFKLTQWRMRLSLIRGIKFRSRRIWWRFIKLLRIILSSLKVLTSRNPLISNNHQSSIISSIKKRFQEEGKITRTLWHHLLVILKISIRLKRKTQCSMTTACSYL